MLKQMPEKILAWFAAHKPQKLALPAWHLPQWHVRERWHAIASRLRGKLWPTFGAAGAIGIVLAALWLHPSFVRLYEQLRAEKQSQPFKLIKEAQLLAAAGRSPEAFSMLRRAIDEAPDAEDRAAAGLAMGRLLLEYARERPNPYAQMARGYLEAAFKMTAVADRQAAAARELTEAAALLDDYPAALQFCETALKLTETSEERAPLLLMRLDLLQRVGSWAAVMRAWEESRACRDQPEWKPKFVLREGAILAAALAKPDWYAELVAQFQGQSDPVALRLQLYRRALELFDEAGRMASELADESAFRAIQLAGAENQWEEARRRIARYFEDGFSRHNEDIMLLLTRISRVEGETPATTALVTRCMERLQWANRTAPEVMELVEAAEAVGHSAEALYYLEEYLKVQGARRQEHPQLLFKAGRLAAQLERYQPALQYYGETLAAGPDDDLAVMTLLAAAEVNLQLGELKAAQDALVTVLTRFPYDPRRGRVLYRLVDVFGRSNASLADILMVTTLAVNVAPNDPAAVGVLMQLARLYEKLGLYSEAQDKYAKVALLRTIAAGRKDAQTAPAIPVAEALLGSARCLMKMGEITRADRVLRELCQINKVDPIHSMAAYLWATIAMDQRQYQEAKRRLALIELSYCPPDVRVRAQLDGMVIDIASEKRAPESVVDYLKNLGETDVEMRNSYIRRAYDIAFERVLQKEPPERVQGFIDRAQEKTDLPPFANWAMRLASRLLQEKGMTAFQECLQYNLQRLQGKADAGRDLRALLEMAAALENTKTQVLQQLQ